MEWSWRTVLILIGLVTMVAILIDGFRRMRRARAEALRLDVSEDFKFPEEGYNPELPGEVRVVGGFSPNASSSDQPSDPQQSQPSFDEVPAFSALDDEPEVDSMRNTFDSADLAVPSESNVDQAVRDAVVEVSNETDNQPRHSQNSDAAVGVQTTALETGAETTQDEETPVEPNSPLVPKAKPLNLDENVPVLLDVEELGEDTDVVSDTVSDVAPDETETVNLIDALPEAVANTETEAASAEPTEDPLDEAPEAQHVEESHSEESKVEMEAEPQPMTESFAETAQIITHPVNFAGADAEVLAHRPPAEVVLVIHAIAQSDQGFRGSDLIYLFNSCDLRYGEKNIFHRFEEADGAGNIQFSVSQSYEPGTFEPGRMADQQFPGLIFFMSLPGAKRPLEAYEAMYEMAMVVARNLKADLLDESLSALTPQTVEANREEIMTFERHQHLMMKKQGTR
ncbi:hypothetical protein A3759_09490 [Thalassolituus sp. HI0120]|nr:hypothetical protein A3759_09490 [Thalassolituus sp. HI0120]